MMKFLHAVRFLLASLSLTVFIACVWIGLSPGPKLRSLSHNDCPPGDCETLRCQTQFSQLAGPTDCNDTASKTLLNKLVSCREGVKTLQQKLDWEISRSDWSDPVVAERQQSDLIDVSIVVNNRKTIRGFRKSKEVYVPFSFLKQHYGIHGAFKDEPKNIFEWKNAVINQWKLPKKYKPDKEYPGLGNANVEQRRRVKCVDGIYGVPVTTQWDKNGYFYATQIAQYGLSHYSKFVTKSDVKRTYIIDDGSRSDVWITSSQSFVKTIFEASRKKNLTYFSTKGNSELDTISTGFEKIRKLPIISLEVKLSAGSKMIIQVILENMESLYLNYVPNNKFIDYVHPNIYFGIGKSTEWRRITRDVNNDCQKGIAQSEGANKKNFVLLGVKRIMLYGSGYVGSLILSSSAHDEMFMNAGKWLLHFQDETGGWQVNVTRKITRNATSPPGWRSAMASGQAISLLCRIFSHTKQSVYLSAAKRALKLFEIPVEENGIVSKFMDKYKMYEEYPTRPPLHVLNGFIFSLIGLYDLSRTDKTARRSKELFDEGIRTLIAILPLYDNGFGTFYDLRHIVMPGVEPNRARWDYHAVHLGQLQLIQRITHSPQIGKILERWTRYVEGIPAKHN